MVLYAVHLKMDWNNFKKQQRAATEAWISALWFKVWLRHRLKVSHLPHLKPAISPWIVDLHRLPLCVSVSIQKVLVSFLSGVRPDSCRRSSSVVVTFQTRWWWAATWGCCGFSPLTAPSPARGRRWTPSCWRSTCRTPSSRWKWASLSRKSPAKGWNTHAHTV